MHEAENNPRSDASILGASPGRRARRLLIRPGRSAALDAAELWSYRQLLAFLIWRDIKVRYKQTALGALWAVFQPLLTMLVFTLFFGRLAGIPSDGVPYPLFAFCALVPWTFFANGVASSSNSLVASAQIIRKVYFPRVLIPVAGVAAGFVDLLIAGALLFPLAFHYGYPIELRMLWLAPLTLLLFATTLGVGIWLSALNVRYRDVRHAVPFLVQAWLFVTPIAYGASLVPAAWRTTYALNPMTGVVEGFRYALVGAGNDPGPLLAASTLSAALIVVLGLRYFRRAEAAFADVV